MALPIYLTILRKGDINIVDVAEVGALIARSETRVEDAFLQEVSAEILSVALPGYGRSESTAGVQELQRLGGVLFSHLLTAPARQRLRTAESGDLYLRLDEALLQVPWELSYDGEQFLATKFRVGRQVITSAPLPSSGAVPRGQGPLRVLVIADPTETLPQASQEAERLCALLGKLSGVEVTLLGGGEVRKVPLLAALQAHDIVHFAGHSQYDPQTPSHSGWVLHEGILTAGELSKLAHPPLLVFSNSCQAGVTAEWQGDYRAEGQAFGLGSALLLAGVKNYVGTFWVVHDEESVEFATVFYQRVVSGLSLGEALLQARHATITQRGWAGLTWASYLLYGDPAFMLLPTTHDQSLPNGSAIAQSQSVGLLQRKLAAILSADVKGYSRLMGEDEVATIRTLTAYRAVMAALIQQHRGRVVDAPGDNLLAEFASAVDAVQGAVEIQRALKIRNAELPFNRRMEFRIGINVGDVIVEGEKLYGDGVNIAARLEGLAEPGGICIAGTVHDQIENKLALNYEYLGEQTVKNITKPVRVYRVLVSIPSTAAVASSQPAIASRSEQPQVQRPASSVQRPMSASVSPPLYTLHPTPTLVGRETELTQLHRSLEKARQGERQVVFVTGEPGIGKTTLVEAFLQRLESRVQRLSTVQTLDARRPTPDASLWLGQGQCIEHYGVGEAYLPVLSALGQLCREPEGYRLVELLGQQAPSWLIQMPALLSAAEFGSVQRKTLGATRERMLREMAEALEALTAEWPLVLWLEDLHWSDYSTLDLIAFLARRRQPARLLVIGTARPVDGQEHPLQAVKQELHLHGQCEEVALGFLIESDVAEYLAERFAGTQLPAELARAIYRRTEGNPLFMGSVVEHLLAQGAIVHHAGKWELRRKVEDLVGGAPQSLRQLIEQQLTRLTAAEQRVVEAASVAGVEFSAATVAAGMETAVEEAEEQCAGLARRSRLLQARGTADWPDGTVAARYGFLHALYQEVVYGRVTAGRRVRLHQRIGEREEQAYGARVREIAAELAMHFERGRDNRRAVQYLEHAGQNAMRRSAHQEAIAHLTKGLELLKILPDTPTRTEQELRLQISLGTALIVTKGYNNPDVGQTYSRAWELCQQLGETPQLFTVLGGLYTFYSQRDLGAAYELAERLLRLAQRAQDATMLLRAHQAAGAVLSYMGRFAPARTHLEQSLALYDAQQHRANDFVQDPRVTCLCLLSQVLYLLGYPDQALKTSTEALMLARGLSHPFSLANALGYAAAIYAQRGERQEAQALTEAQTELAREHGFAQFLAAASFYGSVRLIKQGQIEQGIAQARTGLAAYRATGAELGRLYLLPPLAEAYGAVGQATEGLRVIEEALTLVDSTGKHDVEARLYRVKGDLLLAAERVIQTPRDRRCTSLQEQRAAEECFFKAIAIARRQSAKSYELQATISLARLWQQQGKNAEARHMLAEIYGWFTEGFDTKDLQEAKALLEGVSRTLD